GDSSPVSPANNSRFPPPSKCSVISVARTRRARRFLSSQPIRSTSREFSRRRRASLKPCIGKCWWVNDERLRMSLIPWVVWARVLLLASASSAAPPAVVSVDYYYAGHSATLIDSEIAAPLARALSIEGVEQLEISSQ